MRELVKKITVILIIISIFMVTFLISLPVDNNNIYESLLDKHSYIVESEEKNIIIIGGSNVLMGIDSELIEENLEYKVVNMGINAGLGLRFMLNDIKNYIKEGDIVVIASEYAHYFGKLNGESALLFLFKQLPSEVKYISKEQIPILIESIPYFIRCQITGIIKGMEADEIQNRQQLNKNGDLISHLDKKSIEITGWSKKIGNIELDTFNVLNKFNMYAKSKGARVVISYPSLYDEVYYDWKEGIQELDTLLRNETDIPVISDYNNYKFSKNEMYDSIYHLNGVGRERRTKQLIDDLNQYINYENR